MKRVKSGHVYQANRARDEITYHQENLAPPVKHAPILPRGLDDCKQRSLAETFAATG